MSLSCTIFLVVDDSKKQEIILFENLLNHCGVKHELFTCCKAPVSDEIKRLNPNLTLTPQHHYPKELNEAVNNSTTEYIVFINVPFIGQDGWLKEYLNFLEKSEANCLIVPYLNYLKDFDKSEFLNPYGEIMDIQISDTKPNDILGMHIFRTATFNVNGGFVGYPETCLSECLIHYRKKTENVIVYNGFLNVLRDEIFNCKLNKDFLKIAPVKEFSPVEEIAYHNLDSFFENKLKKPAIKFMLDYLGLFGFRCDSLTSDQINEIILYATHYNLQFEIKYASVKTEKRIGFNIFVLMKQKK